MPKAPRKASCGCGNLHPCMSHPWGWRRNDATYGSPFSRQQKKAIKLKARGKCQKCGTDAPDGAPDHIIPRSQGGVNELWNGQWLCQDCHRKKTVQESIAGLRRKYLGNSNR